jgi:hypothetical protein
MMAPNHDLIRDVNIMRRKVSCGKELRSPLKSLRTLELLSRHLKIPLTIEGSAQVWRLLKVFAWCDRRPPAKTSDGNGRLERFSKSTPISSAACVAEIGGGIPPPSEMLSD